MDIRDWLKNSIQRLETANVSTARLDCLVLLEDETGKDRSWLLAHPKYELQIEQLNNLSTKLAQRSKNTPLAYIRGTCEFYGREFAVNQHVLVPRPESEAIIELLKSLWDGGPAKHKMTMLADIGAGSGSLAITAKLELPTLDVIATDIDKLCLRIAQENARTYNVAIATMEGDLAEPLFGMQPSADILLCNLPYVPNDYEINAAAKHEPELALYGGSDGLELYRRLFNQLRRLQPKPRYIFTESLPQQHDELAAIARAAGYQLQKTDDFIQLYTKT